MLAHARPQHLVQRQRHFGVLGRVLGRPFDADLVEADLARALAAHLLVRERAASQVPLGQRLHVVPSMGLQHIRLQQRVVLDALQRDAVIGQHMRVVLEVLADLRMARRLQPWAQLLEHALQPELLRRPRVAVRERDVAGLVLRDRQRNADQARLHRIERRGLRVQARQWRGLDPRDPLVQLLFGQYRLVAHGRRRVQRRLARLRAARFGGRARVRAGPSGGLARRRAQREGGPEKRVSFLEPAAKLEALEQPSQRLRIGRTRLQRLQRRHLSRQVRIGPNGDQ